MGKIMVIGKAEHDYPPDRCDVKFEIEVTRKTASEASSVCSTQYEQLLAALQELGISPEAVELHNDRIEKQSRYNSDEINYESTRTLQLHLPADMQLINTLRAIIESGFEDVSFSTIYYVSNEAELTKQLLKEAIVDSKRKADLLAASIDMQIISIDSANLSGDEDVYDLCEEKIDDGFVCRRAEELGRVLSDQVKPEKVTLSSEVKVIWIAG